MSIKININGQTVTLLDNSQLTIFNNKTKQVDSFIYDLMFPNKVAFNGESTVSLSELDTKSPLAPFVIPTAQSETINVASRYERKHIEAPYMKPNRVINPKTVRDQALLAIMYDAGLISRIDTMSKAEQYRVAQVANAQWLVSSRDNRLKMMGLDIMKTGKTIIAGDSQPAFTIDYGRDARLSFTPIIKWDQPEATPVTDMETMIDYMVDVEGSGPRIVLTSSKLFGHMNKNGEFKERFVKNTGVNGADRPAFPGGFNTKSETAVLKGTLDGIAFWTYDASHQLNKFSGSSTGRYIEEDEFFMISDTSGFDARCQIQHLDVDGQALDYYMYMVEEKDPSGVKMILDSAAMPVPSTPNGVIGGNNFLTK